MPCEDVIPGTFIACGEGGNYCSDECLTIAETSSSLRWSTSEKRLENPVFWQRQLLSQVFQRVLTELELGYVREGHTEPLSQGKVRIELRVGDRILSCQASVSIGYTPQEDEDPYL